jgi:hypothetical protein
VRELARDHRFVVNPCKGYVPLYSPQNRIFASFVPTRDGLYVGLVGDGFGALRDEVWGPVRSGPGS